MNVDDLLALDRELTDEETSFMEQELLKAVQEFSLMSAKLCMEIEEKDPEMAAKLRHHAASMKENVEKAAAISLDETESLFDEMRDLLTRPEKPF